MLFRRLPRPWALSWAAVYNLTILILIQKKEAGLVASKQEPVAHFLRKSLIWWNHLITLLGMILSQNGEACEQLAARARFYSPGTRKTTTALDALHVSLVRLRPAYRALFTKGPCCSWDNSSLTGFPCLRVQTLYKWP
jgi:hypothetical protein